MLVAELQQFQASQAHRIFIFLKSEEASFVKALWNTAFAFHLLVLGHKLFLGRNFCGQSNSMTQ